MKPVLLPILLGVAAGFVVLVVMSGGSSDSPPPRETSRPANAPAESVQTAQSDVAPRIVVPDEAVSVRSADRILAPFLPARKMPDPKPVRPAGPVPAPASDRAEAPVETPAEVAAAPEAPVETSLPPVPLMPPPEASGMRPRIAVVIDDMGFDAKNSRRAVLLPAAVTLAYLPFAPAAAQQVRAARLRGHEIMLHLPMEADEHRGHPGPNVLSTSQTPEALRGRLKMLMRSFAGYIGVNNHQGSRLTRDTARMRVVLSELQSRGLFFLDSRTTGNSVAAKTARDLGMVYGTRDVFLDHDPDPSEIKAQIEETERIALATGQAIAIGHPRDTTMRLIAPWLANIEERGFLLVPVSDLLHRPMLASDTRAGHVSRESRERKALARNAATE